MASYNAISVEKLVRLIGTPKGPVVIDVRDDEDFAAQPLLLPASFRRPLRRRAAMGAGLSRPLGRRGLSEGQEAKRRCRRLAAKGRRRGRDAGRRV